ncbi:allophanate hydrolase 2 subunit 1 [Photobacterium aphoticum]|uniref:Allophanate hydrolase 2 subunit 1 n=1 Tax=Photobacterium aphoticum TaxID=754436 RepID=A0A090QUJ7_9GAMM|nr:allophanate hydrolase 2 subunit 1 [Photobacterium aphoticum]
MTYSQLALAIEAYALTYQKGNASTEASGSLIALPVYYGRDVGPDLQAVAEHAGLSVEEVIAIHSGQTYTVCAIGFAPGFAFLASVDARIAMPRQVTPRQQVPAGSVGIANQQTAVYPNASPGGWQIIGNCPVGLFSPDATPMTPFSVGDTVQFTPIDREAFLQQGGELWPR